MNSDCGCNEYVICLQHGFESGHLEKKIPANADCPNQDCLCGYVHEKYIVCMKCGHV